MGLTKLAIKNYITVFILVFITFVVGLQAYLGQASQPLLAH